jgi:glucose-6-phosphate isomerase
MDEIVYSYVHAEHIPLAEQYAEYEQIAAHIKKSILEKTNTGYDFAGVPFADQKQLLKCIQQQRDYKPDIVLVVGIGGSASGSQALYQALFGTYGQPNKPELMWIDTIDPVKTFDQYQSIEHALRAQKKITLIIISKSGSTTETIANAALFFELLKKNDSLYKQNTFIITDRDSALWHFASKECIESLEIPQSVGGRFSIFTAVGMLPLGIAGASIEAILDGARQATYDGTHLEEDNDALTHALIRLYYYHNNKHIHDFFVLSPSLTEMGQWFRQLMGESLGKTNQDNKPIGLTPTVSIGSNDLHSVAQLYLGGPDVRYTTFIDGFTQRPSLEIPDTPLAHIVPGIKNKTVIALHNALSQGIIGAYANKGLPFTYIDLDTLNETSLGYFMQTCMLEIVYLAHGMKVNPFDQPHVELYKQETRKALTS